MADPSLLDTRIKALGSRMAALENRMDALEERMGTLLYWTALNTALLVGIGALILFRL